MDCRTANLKSKFDQAEGGRLDEGGPTSEGISKPTTYLADMRP